MRINLNFTPRLDKCPDCGNEQEFGPGNATCRACGYHAGNELAQQWIDRVEEMDATIPQGIDLAFAHEAESLTDYYIDVRFAGCEADIPTAWLRKFSETFGVDSCEIQGEARHDGAEEDYLMSGTPAEIAEYFEREGVAGQAVRAED
jgi:hypothetical protein